MHDGYRVIDTTRHVIEPAGLWDTRLQGPHAGAVQVDAGTGTLTVKGRPVVRPRPNLMTQDFYKDAFKGAVEAGFTAESNLADMDREGVDAATLLPTLGLYAAYADHVDAALAADVCRAYNDWLHDYCATDAGRLKGVALLALQDAKEAATELRRAVEELGFVAGLVRPNPVAGRPLHHPAYDLIYGEAESLGVPIVVSELGGTVLPEMGVERFESFFAREAVVDPFEMMLAFMSFMGHNVLERFPGLKVGYLGAGVGWLPYWLDRVDEHWGGYFGDDAPSTLAPSHLFRTQGFASADPWEHSISDVIVECGVRTVVWGSQYPMPEVAPLVPDELGAIVRDELLTDDQKRAILWQNAADLYKIT